MWILILINKSFGDDQKEVLSLWLSHRFDTYKDKFVIKSYNIPKEQFNIIEKVKYATKLSGYRNLKFNQP